MGRRYRQDLGRGTQLRRRGRRISEAISKSWRRRFEVRRDFRIYALSACGAQLLYSRQPEDADARCALRFVLCIAPGPHKSIPIGMVRTLAAEFVCSPEIAKQVDLKGSPDG